MPPLKTSAPPVKPAQDPSVDTATKLTAVLNEIKRGNMTQQSDMKKLMDTMKKDIVMAGLGPVLKILDTINKLVALVIMPFTNLIMPLLLPILYFLSPIVRFLNVAMRPLFIQLMDWAKNQKGKVTAAADAFKSGDLLGGLSSMVSIMSEGFQLLLKGIQPYLDAALKAINIDGLIKMAQEKLQGIWDFVKTAMDDGFSGLKDWWTKLELDKHVSSILASMSTIANDFFKNYVTPFIDGILGSVGGVKTTITNVLSTASRVLQDTYTWIVQKAQDWYNYFVDSVKTPFFEKVREGLEILEKGLNKIVGIVKAGMEIFSSAKTTYDEANKIGWNIRSAITGEKTPSTNTGRSTESVTFPGQPRRPPGVDTSIAFQDSFSTSIKSGVTELKNITTTLTSLKGSYSDQNEKAELKSIAMELSGLKNAITEFKNASARDRGSQSITIRLVDSMNNTISSQRLQAGSGANMTFTV